MSRRHLLLFFLAGVIVYFAVAFTNKAMDNLQVQKRAEAVRQEVASLEEENEKLRQSLDYYNSDAYVEKEAREKLNMVKPGEHLLVVTGAPTPTPETGTSRSAQPETRTPPAQNWQRWWEYFAHER